jgi:hypothetical protein
MEQYNFQKNRFRIPKLLTKPKNLFIIGSAAIALIVVGFLVLNQDSSKVLTAEDRPTIKIGKSYEVVARTKEGRRTTGRFELTVTNAQFADSILVQGKRARPVTKYHFTPFP